ncbi:MAG: lysophospholipid acyltransferase family protein [Eubacteriales bacterium]
MCTLKEDIKNSSSHILDFMLDTSVERALSKKGIAPRKLIGKPMGYAFASTTKYKLHVDSIEKVQKGSKGKIYAITHRQSEDIIFAPKLVQGGGYFVLGNKYLFLDTTNGFAAWVHGAIFLDRKDKENRKATYNKMKFVLENGGNIIIYPEGYFNIVDDGQPDANHNADDHNSESWLIQDFNIGLFRLAKEVGCDLIPTVLHYDEMNGLHCYAKVGQAFSVDKEDDLFEKKQELLDIMQGMYYELMEKYSFYRRKDVEVDGFTLKEHWDKLTRELSAVCCVERTGYQLEMDDEKLIGKAPVPIGVVTNEMAFEHLKHISITKANCFLLRKSRIGLR